MIAVPGSVGAAAAPRPVAALAADGASGASPAGPGGFEELFTEGRPAKAERSERRPHKDEPGEEGAAAGAAPGMANAPPESAHEPRDGTEEPAAEGRLAGQARSPGSAGPPPAGAATDGSAPSAGPAPDVAPHPEGHLDVEQALSSGGRGSDLPAPEPDAAEAAPSGGDAEAKPPAEGPDAPMAESPRTSGSPLPVAAVVAGLKPLKAEVAAAQHDRHRRNSPDEPAPDKGATGRDAHPEPRTTATARPDHAPDEGQARPADRPLLADAGRADPAAVAFDSRAAASDGRLAPDPAARAPHPLPDGFVLRLAPHLPHQGARAVEITLTPEELGKVRMHVALSGDALTLTIAAHRPETLDLLRSHIDQLAQEFRDLGFDRLEFGFARDQGQQSLAGQGDGPDPREGAAADRAAACASPTAKPPRDLALAGGAGLDLRL